MLYQWKPDGALAWTNISRDEACRKVQRDFGLIAFAMSKGVDRVLAHLDAGGFYGVAGGELRGVDLNQGDSD
jgi:hypothetical protein